MHEPVRAVNVTSVTPPAGQLRAPAARPHIGTEASRIPETHPQQRANRRGTRAVVVQSTRFEQSLNAGESSSSTENRARPRTHAHTRPCTHPTPTREVPGAPIPSWTVRGWGRWGACDVWPASVFAWNGWLRYGLCRGCSPAGFRVLRLELCARQVCPEKRSRSGYRPLHLVPRLPRELGGLPCQSSNSSQPCVDAGCFVDLHARVRCDTIGVVAYCSPCDLGGRMNLLCRVDLFGVLS